MFAATTCGADRETPAECLRRGDVAYKLGDFDTAIASYTDALRLDPTYAEAFHNRGAALHMQSKWAEAVRDYTEAIRLNPKYADAYMNRGRSKALPK